MEEINLKMTLENFLLRLEKKIQASIYSGNVAAAEHKQRLLEAIYFEATGVNLKNFTF